MSANPAVITNDDWFCVLDILSPALHFCLVGGGEDGHIGTYHYTITAGIDGVSAYRHPRLSFHCSHRDQAAIEYREVEAGIEAITKRDITSEQSAWVSRTWRLG